MGYRSATTIVFSFVILGSHTDTCFGEDSGKPFVLAYFVVVQIEWLCCFHCLFLVAFNCVYLSSYVILLYSVVLVYRFSCIQLCLIAFGFEYKKMMVDKITYYIKYKISGLARAQLLTVRPLRWYFFVAVVCLMVQIDL